MILIADSGSTKTDWTLLSAEGVQATMQTAGINPVHQDESVIRATIGELKSSAEFSELLETEQLSVSFYGAGCSGNNISKITTIIGEVLTADEVEVNGDLLAAARALCGDEEGVACILGTGSNSCVYDGSVIVANIPPLGYILGDEGSGAVLGRRFVNYLLKACKDEPLKEKFFTSHGLTYPLLIERVYRAPGANRFLASFCPFIHEHLDNPEVEQVVTDNFRDFIINNVAHYERPDLPVGAVGSVAWAFREQWERALDDCGFKAGAIVKAPMERLIDYHRAAKGWE